MNRGVALIVGLLVLVATEPAFACAVCFDANEESRGAFLGTTILLSLLPLGLIGGFAWFIRRRARQLAAEELA